MSVPAKDQTTDSSALDSNLTGDSGGHTSAPLPPRVADFLVPQNRTLAATTQGEQSADYSPGANGAPRITSSYTVDFKTGHYLPRVVFAQEARVTFRALQKWEGYVLDVAADTFRAHLTPLRGEGREQVAEIYLTELDDDDRALVQPGAVFYWSIGYLDRPAGRLRASILRFRRLPGWTRQELARAQAEADRLRAIFADE
jgi:hypothetical protein